ncbi:hypothetical protein [Fodinicurvata sp. EGI_FJ10296]|uniref:hypothetical protein n=1 Tax=Fodinicurvata sp. EGI_FJ10296 TaxID=3231908 RepID=UPI003451BE14
MIKPTDLTIRKVARSLKINIYNEEFRGKKRGRFCLTRRQLKTALGVERLRSETIQKLQDEALEMGLVIIDLDETFPCVEKDIVEKYRRPPAEVFSEYFPINETDDFDMENNENEE